MSTAVELLKAIPNPVDRRYRITIVTPELTFLGNRDQPDFASLTVEYEPGDLCIELKSFKKYVQAFRDTLYSYERITNVIHDDLAERFKPLTLKVRVDCNPRGGATTSIEVGWVP